MLSLRALTKACQPDARYSFTNKYQKHKASGFCYLMKCFDDILFPPILRHYTSQSEEDDIAQMSVDSLESDINKIYHKFKFHKKADKSMKNQVTYDNATHYHICQEELGEDKVWDHCHHTGNFRGAAHNECNLQYKIPKFIAVIFHNLSGYDSHLFIKKIGTSDGKIKCIPNNEEKYISFSKEIVVDSYINKEGRKTYVKIDIRFIDSFKFMSTSLERLVSNLPKESFLNLSRYYEGEQLQLLLRKGIFPYDWCDGIAFYSRLNDTNISQGDYNHAQKVWNAFGMKTMRNYLDLYLNSDVLLLADVFESFRDVCSGNYGLDPAWYYTLPGLSLDACLKITRVKLELLTDPDMLLMMEQGIPGGVSMVSKRYSQANNKYMENYNPDLPNKYIIYLDANNLYGWAMIKALPTHGFRWMSGSELKQWKNLPCIVEVDLEYPENLHDLHNDYPLAPERINVNKVDKLIPNLNNKTKYVIHHAKLKADISHGLKVTKIHRGITFHESDWLRPYIELNTNLRMKAKTEFEKDFFKLMNNSVFG